jgi:hypothetical protein
MFADGGLAGMEKFGGLGETLVLVDCNEYSQMSGFDGRILSGNPGPAAECPCGAGGGF